MNGPLGKPSYEDDERERALRKDSFLFCLGLLACLNCLGQPFLMILSHLQNWQTAHSANVAMSALIVNATLFGSLPTLYASWNLRQLPKE
jgi:cytochrome c biogenesis protein CcdA